MAEPGQFGFLPVAGDGHGLVAGQAEQLDVLQHARQVGIADVVTLVGLADRSFRAELVAADEPGVAVGERQPPLIAGRGGRVGPAVAHRPVEVAEEPAGCGRPIARPAARRGPDHGRAVPAATAAERPELQRQGPQLRRVVRQGRVSEVPGEGELAEPGGEHVYLQDCRPGQLPGLQLQVGVELDAFSQPGRRDVVPADRRVPVGFMVAARIRGSNRRRHRSSFHHGASL